MKRLATLMFGAMLLAGCSPAVEPGAPTPDPAPTSAPAPTSEPPAPAETASAPSGSASAVAPDSPAASPPSDPVAGAAWEALMGPDGEYAAAAAYQAVIDEFGEVEPYVTIKRSEERHIEALIRQLDRLGIEAPPNPYLGTIAAPPSLQQAAKDWADGEVANVDLYDELMAKADGDEKLTRVFTNLRRASEEVHLPLFRLAADGDGTLTADQMAEHQGGQRQGKQRGPGRGRGN